jgi:hypothetical protein
MEVKPPHISATGFWISGGMIYLCNAFEEIAHASCNGKCFSGIIDTRDTSYVHREDAEK